MRPTSAPHATEAGTVLPEPWRAVTQGKNSEVAGLGEGDEMMLSGESVVFNCIFIQYSF